MLDRIELHENVLTTDYIEVAPDGYHFKGHNGAKYLLVYYTYANEWSDRENVKYFKSYNRLREFYNKLNRGDISYNYGVEE